MSYEQYLDAYNTFWELKEKYDKKRLKTIKSLKKATTKHQIKLDLQQFDEKRRCVNCNKPGGTIFEITKTHLKCICNANKKCKLNIHLKKAKHVNLTKEINDKINIVNSVKQDILGYKLDLLFGNLEEEVVLNQFTRLKQILDDAIHEKNKYQELFDQKNKMLEIENSEEGDSKFILKSEYINEKQKQLNQHISDFKKNIVLFKESNNKALLSDTILLYKNTIMPLQDEIRNLTYKRITIEKEENAKKKGSLKLMPKFIVQKSKLTIEDKMTYDNFKIIKNEK